MDAGCTPLYSLGQLEKLAGTESSRRRVRADRRRPSPAVQPCRETLISNARPGRAGARMAERLDTVVGFTDTEWLTV